MLRLILLVAVDGLGQHHQRLFRAISQRLLHTVVDTLDKAVPLAAALVSVAQEELVNAPEALLHVLRQVLPERHQRQCSGTFTYCFRTIRTGTAQQTLANICLECLDDMVAVLGLHRHELGRRVQLLVLDDHERQMCHLAAAPRDVGCVALEVVHEPLRASA